MTRAVAVAALVGCACMKPSPDVAAPDRTACPACPTCSAVPTVDLALCPVERPPPSPVVTEPAVDPLIGGGGFWCTLFTTSKLAGEGDCFRYREPCEEWRPRGRKRAAWSECRRVERASCVKVTDHKRMATYYRCFPTAVCEAIRATMIARRPYIVITECRETD